MADISGLENVINGIVEFNSRLDRIVANTELTAESVIETIPASQPEGARLKDSVDFSKRMSDQLAAIYACIEKSYDSLMVSNSYLKPIMEDIATITMFLTELTAVKPGIPVKPSGKVDVSKMSRTGIAKAEDVYKGILKEKEAESARKVGGSKGKGRVEREDKRDTFEGLGLTGAIVSSFIDIGREMVLLTQGFANLITSGFKKFLKSGIGKKIANVFAGAFKIAQDIAGDLKKAWNKLADSKYMKPVVSAIASVSKAIYRVISNISSYIAGIFKRITPGLTKIAGKIIDKLPSVRKIVDIGKAAFGRVFGEKQGKEPAGTEKETQRPEGRATPERKEKKGILGKIDIGIQSVLKVAKALRVLARGFGNVVKSIMINLADGVKAFGDTKVLKGSAALLVVSGALFVTTKALKEFQDISWESLLKGGAALLGLAGTARLIGGMKSDILAGALGIAALGGALWLASKGFEAFGELDWSALGKAAVGLGGLALAGAAIGAAAELILPGALAIAALGGALWVAGKGFNSFAEIDWDTIKVAFGAVAGIGVIGALLGAASPAILAGSMALGAISVALVAFGAAMKVVGSGMDDMVSSLEKLSKIGGFGLLKVAAGITAIGASMAAFAIGSVVSGLSNLVTKFLSLGSDTPIEQLIKLGTVGSGIESAAAGLDKLAEVMKKMSDLPKGAMDAINEFPWIKATAFAAVGGEMEVSREDTTVRVGARIVSPQEDAMTANVAGAKISAYQKETEDISAEMTTSMIAPSVAQQASAPVVTNTSNVSSVIYNNTNIPDRTTIFTTPAFAY